jgi:hypothetical protein
MLLRIGSAEEGPPTWGLMSRKKDAIASDLMRREWRMLAATIAAGAEIGLKHGASTPILLGCEAVSGYIYNEAPGSVVLRGRAASGMSLRAGSQKDRQ